MIHTIDFSDRLACELCGEDHVELREISTLPNASIWCRPCYGGPHDEHEWTDFPLAQEAAQ